MGNFIFAVNKRLQKLFRIVTLLIVVLVIPGVILGGENNDKLKEHSKARVDFMLTLKDNLISLKAKDASLIEILEEIGSKMKIEVVATISESDMVTLEFDRLPLENALERLTSNYAYIVDSKDEKGKIKKIIVLPKGEGKTLSSGVKASQAKHEEHARKEQQKPEPFKFEFDPSEFVKE